MAFLILRRPLVAQNIVPKSGALNSANNNYFYQNLSLSSTNSQQKSPSINNTSKIPLFIGRSSNFGIYSKNKTKKLLNSKNKEKQLFKSNNEQQIVPFVYSSCASSRETLSSCGKFSEEDSEEEHENDKITNKNSLNLNISPSSLPSSSWHTIGIAHSLLTKIQNKNKKSTKFRTFPLLQRPIFNKNNFKNEEENWKSFSGTSGKIFNSSLSPFSKSFCCTSDNTKLLSNSLQHSFNSKNSSNCLWENVKRTNLNNNKLPKNIKMLQHYRLQKIRHIFGFKRFQNNLLIKSKIYINSLRCKHTTFHLNSNLLSILKEQQQKVNKTTQTFDNKTIYWAIVVFAGLSLFFGIISFLFNILLLVWQIYVLL
uniref:Uncharacterized protein n=1 Tax=Meloidogyne enterolobii TaxID=390850 RepID=A0A6V7VPL7_MELEN|nr:unnamed protein product [Meloidogyne enterolobii]